MRKPAFFMLFMVILLSACTPNPSQPTATAGLAALPIIAGTAQMPPDYLEARQGALWVRVLSPRDGSIIEQSQVDISGQAAPGSLLSINGREMLVPPDQFFRLTLALEPGLNVIEISTSDAAANQIKITLSVTRQP